MKPLATPKQVLTLLYIIPFDKKASKCKRTLSIILIIGVFGTQVCAFTSCVAFALKYMSTNLTESLFAMSNCLLFLNVIYGVVIMPLLQHKIFILFEQLEKIYEMDTNQNTFGKLNEKCERIWNSHFKRSLPNLCLNMIAVSLLSVVFSFYKTEKFDRQFVFVPINFLLPWNQESSFGYFTEMCFTLMVTEVYAIFNSIVMLMFIFTCLQHRAFHKIFRKYMNKLDFPEKKRNKKQILCDVIQFHGSIKSWFLCSADICNHFMAVEVLSDIIILTCGVFLLDLQLQNTNFDIFLVWLFVSIGASNLFACCYFGNMASESYEKMANCLFESNWLDLSIDLQKYFIIMIANAQTPIHYYGFKIVVLNLETLKTCIRKVFTYYTVFKTITSN